MKKRTVILYLLCACVILSCLACASCGRKTQKYSANSFAYFDTVTTVSGYAGSREEFDAVCADVFAMLQEYHRLFNVYERYEGIENLCTVNSLENGAHRTVQVDGKIIDHLLFAKEIYEKTDGAVNVAMGSVLSVWHEYREAGLRDPASATLPPVEILEKASAHTDIGCLDIDAESGTVTLTDPDALLDVGAVAKGYAVEMIAQELERKGICGYVLNVGGNVRTVGRKANGEKWIVGIENPTENTDEPYAAYLALAGESVVTSGSYQRYYVVDGKRRHHIIDPQTLFPAEGYLSVSVVCKSSALGDALSTALFCMSLEEGEALLNTIDGAEAMWILSNGEKRYSNGFSAYATHP